MQRLDHARTFRDARHELRLTLSQCAALLRVSVRTLRNWESGQVRIPYAAFKLMRVLRGGKYLGPHWKDFYVRGDRLVTPEGHEFHAGDLSWLSLCVRQAEMYRTLSRQQRQGRQVATAEAGAPGGTERQRRDDRRNTSPLADVASSLLAQVRSAPLAARPRKGQQCGSRSRGSPFGLGLSTEASLGETGSAKHALSTSPLRGERGELSLTPQPRPKTAASRAKRVRP